MGREMGYNLKRSFSREIIFSGKLNVKMTPQCVLRVFRTARYPRLYRQIFFNEKNGLLSMLNINFYDAQITWKNIVSVSFQGIFMTIITF